MKQTGSDITPAEQWALLRWKAGHMVPFVQDTTADLPERHARHVDRVRSACRPLPGWVWLLLHTLAGVVAALREVVTRR